MNGGLLRKLVAKKSFKAFLADMERILPSPICLKDVEGRNSIDKQE